MCLKIKNPLNRGEIDTNVSPLSEVGSSGSESKSMCHGGILLFYWSKSQKMIFKIGELIWGDGIF